MSALDTDEPARLFAALRREDGRPDLEARRMALGNLTNLLSKEELRELRMRLNAAHYDNFSSLPLEIILHIMEYLAFQELAIARTVRLSWLYKFSSADVAMGILKFHFRTRWEDADLGNATAKQAFLDWLPKAARKRIRKRSGPSPRTSMSLAMSAYHYQLNGRLLPTHHKVEHQYDSGRLAYRFDDRFVVQSLREGDHSTPKVYAVKNRIPIEEGKWFLSNDFLVAAFQSNGHFLTAWSLTSDVVLSVLLPTSPKYMSGRNKQIGIITIKNEILLWKVGGSITYVERPETTTEQLERDFLPEAVIFHPLQQGHFFIFNQDCSVPEILVQEYIEWRYHKTYFTSFGPEINGMWDLNFRIVRVINQNGLCSIGWNPSVRSEYSPDQVATFNMYTLEFGTMTCPSPWLPRWLEQNARAIWKDPCGTLPLPRIPIWLANAASSIEMDHRGPREPLELDFSLHHPGVAERCPGTIGDDDFEIILGDYGYFVWCFDENIQLPLVGSLLDEALERVPAARPLPWWPVLRRHWPMITDTDA